MGHTLKRATIVSNVFSVCMYIFYLKIAKYVYGNADVKFDDTVYTAMFGR